VHPDFLSRNVINKIETGLVVASEILAVIKYNPGSDISAAGLLFIC